MSNRNFSRILWIAASLAYVALLFGLSSISSLRPPLHNVRHSDKLIHALAYAVLGFCLERVFSNNSRSARTSLLMAIACGALYGLSDEIHQAYVPGRSCDFLDALADSVGATIGAFSSLGLRRIMSVERREAPQNSEKT